MATLWLVRHGQTAGFGRGSYRDLTSTGRDQAERLGRWFAERELRPDHVFVGPQPRHAQSWSHCVEAAGGDWPEPNTLPGLDEHDAMEVLAAAVVAWRDRADRWGEIIRAMDEGAASQSAMLALLRAALTAWVEQRLDAPKARPWPSFRHAVQTALDTMTAAAGSGERVVAFTSAGVIGVAVASVLRLPTESAAMDLSYAVYNTSLTEVRFGGGRRSLWRFNTTPHLLAATAI